MGDEGHNGAEDSWSPRLRAVVAHLWNPSETVLVTTRREPFAAYREIESYLIVASPGRPRFLVPLGAGRRTASATLMAYHKLRPHRTQLLRTGLAGGLRSGLLPTHGRHRLRVLVHRDLAAADLPRVSPTQWLAGRLETDHVLAALAVPAATPNAKPTLQLFDDAGRPVGYAKLSWNESTRRQVRNEARNVSQFGPQLHLVHVPALLAVASWRGFDAVVTAPMSPDAVAWGAGEPPPLSVTEEIAAVTGTRDYPLGDSPLIHRVIDQINKSGADPATDFRAALRLAVNAVTGRWGDRVLRHGGWHGDWVPWNLARVGADITVWDWEHSGAETPVGLDLLHWYFQWWFIGRRAALPAAIATMKRAAGPAVAELQGSTDAVAPCAALYLLELSARYLAMHDDGAGWNPRFYPAIINALGELATSRRS